MPTTLVALLLTFVPAPDRQLQALEAERQASAWWGVYHKHNGTYGAAIRTEDGFCWVGVCDGRTIKEGSGVDGYPLEYGSGWVELSWSAIHRTPDGRYYKNFRWFGKARTYREAFKDARERGYEPRPR